MSNTGEFYDHTTFPVTRSTGSSANMRAELDLIETGFNKLPPMTGNALRLVKVGSAATDLTVSGLYETTSNQLLYGTSASRTVYGAGRGFQMEASGPQASISLFRNSADSAAPLVALGKSRGTTAGSSTIVQNGDALGAIVFVGADGTDAETPGAVIQAEVDGTPGANDLPTRLVFSTTADGASSVTERMRIHQTGAVTIGSGLVLGSEKFRVEGGDIQIDNATYLKGRVAASTVTRLFGLNASDVLYIGGIDASHNSMLFVNGGTILATLSASGAFTLGQAASMLGYSTGAGGAVTQLTSKSTGVTLNRPSGQITMNGAALAANTAVGFTLTNSVIGTTDVVQVVIDSGATADAYHAQVDAVGAGSCRISIRNMTAGSLSEAIVLNFVVIRAATA
ncbi:MAG: hypothetical protein RLZZ524_1698 [Pseudomonadota bacterium]